jgi:hypothetical protein
MAKGKQIMDKLIEVKFDKSELKQVPLIWNAMYGNRQGIPANKLRVHNSVLDKLEKILDVEFGEEPVWEILQMTQGRETLAVHRINADLRDREGITLELNQPQFDYLKTTLQQIQWLPAVSRLAEKLSEKFGIEC